MGRLTAATIVILMLILGTSCATTGKKTPETKTGIEVTSGTKHGFDLARVWTGFKNVTSTPEGYENWNFWQRSLWWIGPGH